MKSGFQPRLWKVSGEYYEIDELDVIDEGLITRFMYINDGLDYVEIDDLSHETDLLLEKANEVRKQIAQAYKEEGENIRPLVLVQFPSLSDALIEHVENKLNDMGYTYENKLLASWFSAETTADKKLNSKKLGKINIGTTEEDASPKLMLHPYSCYLNKPFLPAGIALERKYWLNSVKICLKYLKFNPGTASPNAKCQTLWQRYFGLLFSVYL